MTVNTASITQHRYHIGHVKVYFMLFYKVSILFSFVFFCVFLSRAHLKVRTRLQDDI